MSDLKTNLYIRSKNGEFGEPVYHKNILYNGKQKSMPVYKVNVDYLKYNVQNGRIANLRFTKTFKDFEKLDEEKKYEEIKTYLEKGSKSKLVKLGKEIFEQGLKEPLVVIKDGTIVDGNRRYTAIKIIQNTDNKYIGNDYNGELDSIEVIILDEDSAESQRVKKLEYWLQFYGDKEPYKPIDRNLDFYHQYKENNLKIQDIAEATGKTISNIRNGISNIEIINTFLKEIEEEDNYKLAEYLKLDAISSEAIRAKKFLQENPKLLVELFILAKNCSNFEPRNVTRKFLKGLNEKNPDSKITNNPEIRLRLKEFCNKELKLNQVLLELKKIKKTGEKEKYLTSLGGDKGYNFFNNLIMEYRDFDEEIAKSKKEAEKRIKQIRDFNTFLANDFNKENAEKTEIEYLEQIHKKIEKILKI